MDETVVRPGDLEVHHLPQLSSANQEAGEIMICVVCQTTARAWAQCSQGRHKNDYSQSNLSGLARTDIFYRGFVHKEVHASGSGWYTEKNDATAGTRAANRLKELGMLDELCDPLLRSGCARPSLLKGE